MPSLLHAHISYKLKDNGGYNSVYGALQLYIALSMWGGQGSGTEPQWILGHAYTVHDYNKEILWINVLQWNKEIRLNKPIMSNLPWRLHLAGLNLVGKDVKFLDGLEMKNIKVSELLGQDLCSLFDEDPRDDPPWNALMGDIEVIPWAILKR